MHSLREVLQPDVVELPHGSHLTSLVIECYLDYGLLSQPSVGVAVRLGLRLRLDLDLALARTGLQ